jgi:hypothetical protein
MLITVQRFGLSIVAMMVGFLAFIGLLTVFPAQGVFLAVELVIGALLLGAVTAGTTLVGETLFPSTRKRKQRSTPVTPDA